MPPTHTSQLSLTQSQDISQLRSRTALPSSSPRTHRHTPLLPTYSPSASGVASHPVIHTYHPPLPPILTSPYPSPQPIHTHSLSPTLPPTTLSPPNHQHAHTIFFSLPRTIHFTLWIQSCRKRAPLSFEPTNIANAQIPISPRIPDRCNCMATNLQLRLLVQCPSRYSVNSEHQKSQQRT